MFDLGSLDIFEGRWRGGGTIAETPFGGAGPCRGRWSFARGAAPSFAIADYAEERADGSRFDGHGVWGAEGDQLLWFWFDSYAYPPLAPARGGWQDDVLVLEKRTERGIGRSCWSLPDGRLAYSVSFQPPGAADFMPVMSGLFQRDG